MDINIHSIRFDADVKLLTFIKGKLEKLGLFYSEIISAEVFLRLVRSQDADNKVAEIKLIVPGSELFAKKQTYTFEESIDLAVEALRRQIRRHKSRLKRA
jgi:putative sigma-54 modulation protein